mgnify:CR=1 FL=1
MAKTLATRTEKLEFQSDGGKSADRGYASVRLGVMPAMGAILQPTEIRDVVTYLSSLKGGRRGGRSDGEL